jgi:hypothetical protein
VAVRLISTLPHATSGDSTRFNAPMLDFINSTTSHWRAFFLVTGMCSFTSTASTQPEEAETAGTSIPTSDILWNSLMLND